MSYSEQLVHKHTWLKGVYQEFTKSLQKEIKSGQEDSPMWFRENPQIPLNDSVIHSLAIDGYRNKVEFTIGHRYNIEE
jgi:tRNA/tmRNA/rRNA uracil-C5-methylase (TrmA/RlmC/RlmD family)